MEKIVRALDVTYGADKGKVDRLQIPEYDNLVKAMADVKKHGPDHPIKRGRWYQASTGGGCTALVYDLPGPGQKGLYATDDAQAPANPRDFTLTLTGEFTAERTWDISSRPIGKAKPVPGAKKNPMPLNTRGPQGTNAQYYMAERSKKFQDRYAVYDDGPGKERVIDKRTRRAVWIPKTESERDVFQDPIGLVNYLVNIGAIKLPDEYPARANPQGGSFQDVARRHQVAIAKKALRMPDAMVGVMGGPDKAQSREILKAAGWSDKKIEAWETYDGEMPRGNPASGGKVKLLRDGVLVGEFANDSELARYIHKTHSYSVEHAMKHEGYDAVYPDGRTWNMVSSAAREACRENPARGDARTITVDGKKMDATFLGKGHHATAWLVGETVYLFVGDAMKELLWIGLDHGNQTDPHLPQIKRHDDDPRTGKQVYSMPYYKPLTAQDKSAWADYKAVKLALEQAQEEIRKQYGMNFAYRLHNAEIADRVFVGPPPAGMKTWGVSSPEFIFSVQRLSSMMPNYGMGVGFEFAPRNLGVDREGRLILRDVVYDAEKLYQEYEAKRRKSMGMRFNPTADKMIPQRPVFESAALRAKKLKAYKDALASARRGVAEGAPFAGRHIYADPHSRSVDAFATKGYNRVAHHQRMKREAASRGNPPDVDSSLVDKSIPVGSIVRVLRGKARGMSGKVTNQHPDGAVDVAIALAGTKRIMTLLFEPPHKGWLRVMKSNPLFDHPWYVVFVEKMGWEVMDREELNAAIREAGVDSGAHDPRPFKTKPAAEREATKLNRAGVHPHKGKGAPGLAKPEDAGYIMDAGGAWMVALVPPNYQRVGGNVPVALVHKKDKAGREVDKTTFAYAKKSWVTGEGKRRAVKWESLSPAVQKEISWRVGRDYERSRALKAGR